jgi:hypothetical protein
MEWTKIRDHPHKSAFFMVLVPELCCLLLSSAYHLFMAQVKHYDYWLKIDVCPQVTSLGADCCTKDACNVYEISK